MGQRLPRPRIGAGEAAERQSLFREVNERIHELGDRFDLSGEPLVIVCECGNDGCHALLELAPADYEPVRRSPGRFVVVPGHELPAVERIVAGNERFLVVEKIGD
jgi:hypothetical protein